VQVGAVRRGRRWRIRRKSVLQESLQNNRDEGPSQLAVSAMIEPTIELRAGEESLLIQPASTVRRESISVLAVAVYELGRTHAHLADGDLADTVKDFFNLGEWLARETQGRFRMTGSQSYLIYWSGDPVRPFEAVLKLRKQLVSVNENRKTEGLAPLPVRMGLDRSDDLWVFLGPKDRRLEYAVGKAEEGALLLRSWSRRAELDVVVSRAAIQGVGHWVLFKSLGHHEIDEHQEKVELFAIQGYQDLEKGRVEVQTPYSGAVEDAQAKLEHDRWFVNNGHQLQKL
jgi:hypothetical protein